MGDLAGDIVLACVATKGNPAGDVIAIYDVTNNTRQSCVQPFTHDASCRSRVRMYVFTTGEEFKIFEISPVRLRPPNAAATSTGRPFPVHFTGVVVQQLRCDRHLLYGLWLYNTTDARFSIRLGGLESSDRISSCFDKRAGNWLYVSASVSPDGIAITDTRLGRRSTGVNMGQPHFAACA